MTERHSILSDLTKERVLVLDGSMGVMIQRLSLSEDDFRGSRFADHPQALRGNNDILCLSRPEAVADIHRQYLEAGGAYGAGHKARARGGRVAVGLGACYAGAGEV